MRKANEIYGKEERDMNGYFEETRCLSVVVDHNKVQSLVLTAPLSENKTPKEVNDFWRWLSFKKRKKEKKQIDSFRENIDYLHIGIWIDNYGKLCVEAASYIPCSYNEGVEKEKELAPEEKPIAVTTEDGKTVYQIQNINIFITAEVINQLNMNPQQVVNHFSDQIKAQLDDMVKWTFSLKEK